MNKESLTPEKLEAIKERSVRFLANRMSVDVIRAANEFYNLSYRENEIDETNEDKFNECFYEALDVLGKKLLHEFRTSRLTASDCEKCYTPGKFIEKTIGYYDEDEHIVANYYVCPRCGYDWTAYFGEFEGHICSFDGWCASTG